MSQYDPGDYNRGGMVAFAFTMIFTLAFFVYISLIHKGVDLREIDRSQGEASGLAETTEGPAFDPATVTEPWRASEELIAHGKGIYGMQCAMCHGNTGAGDGVASGGLVPPPRNLIEGDWQRGGTAREIYQTLTDGFGAGSSMASYAHLSPVDRWALVHFVRSISNNQPDDDSSALEEFGKSTMN